MAKDAFWFKHDSNAGRDTKLLKLKGIYGEWAHWATGIYWEVNEMLREQDGYKFDSDEPSLQILCSMIGCGDFQKFKKWFGHAVKVGLYVNMDGVFYSESMVHRMKKWESTKENGRRGGLTKAENELGSESDSELCSEPISQNLPLRREERREEKRRGDDEIDWGFEKAKFLADTKWQEDFVRLRGGTVEQLVPLVNEYIRDMEAGHDFKTSKELKRHFNNKYKKFPAILSNNGGLPKLSF